MSSWFILAWATTLCMICGAVISACWYKSSKLVNTQVDNFRDRDMWNDYTQLEECQKEVIRLAVEDMKND